MYLQKFVSDKDKKRVSCCHQAKYYNHKIGFALCNN